MRRRAFSLTETLIMGALLALLLTGVCMFLAYSQRYVRLTEVYDTAQRENGNLQRALSQDLANSSAAWVVYTPKFIRFLAAQPLQFDPLSGKTLWTHWMCYYYDVNSRAVMRATVPLTSPTSQLTVEPLPNALLADFLVAPSDSQRVIARSMDDFRVQALGANLFQFDSTASAVAAVAAVNDSIKTATVSLSFRVTILNP